jgi:hypothetical protein
MPHIAHLLSVGISFSLTGWINPKLSISLCDFADVRYVKPFCLSRVFGAGRSGVNNLDSIPVIMAKKKIW